MSEGYVKEVHYPMTTKTEHALMADSARRALFGLPHDSITVYDIDCSKTTAKIVDGNLPLYWKSHPLPHNMTLIAV